MWWSPADASRILTWRRYYKDCGIEKDQQPPLTWRKTSNPLGHGERPATPLDMEKDQQPPWTWRKTSKPL
eukprot:1144200-Pelagomonas_calceolata.AAC.9